MRHDRVERADDDERQQVVEESAHGDHEFRVDGAELLRERVADEYLAERRHGAVGVGGAIRGIARLRDAQHEQVREEGGGHG